MLSVQQCRAALGGRPDLTDNDIERLRTQLYAIAEVAVHQFKVDRDRPHESKTGVGSGPDALRARALKLMPDDQRETFEERAAIMEFDGGINRDVAERRALMHIVRKPSGN